MVRRQRDQARDDHGRGNSTKHFPASLGHHREQQRHPYQREQLRLQQRRRHACARRDVPAARKALYKSHESREHHGAHLPHVHRAERRPPCERDAACADRVARLAAVEQPQARCAPQQCRHLQRQPDRTRQREVHGAERHRERERPRRVVHDDRLRLGQSGRLLFDQQRRRIVRIPSGGVQAAGCPVLDEVPMRPTDWQVGEDDRQHDTRADQKRSGDRFPLHGQSKPRLRGVRKKFSPSGSQIGPTRCVGDDRRSSCRIHGRLYSQTAGVPGAAASVTYGIGLFALFIVAKNAMVLVTHLR